MHEYAPHGEHLTLPALNMEISNDMVDEYLAEMVNIAHTDAIVNVAKAMRERRKNSPKEAGGVISTAQRYLRLYNDPIVANDDQYTTTSNHPEAPPPRADPTPSQTTTYPLRTP